MITIGVKKKIFDTEFSVETTVENKEEAKRELKELHDVIKVTDDLFPQSSGKWDYYRNSASILGLTASTHTQNDTGFGLVKRDPTAYIRYYTDYEGRSSPAFFPSSYLARTGCLPGPGFLWVPQIPSLPSVEKKDISQKSLKKSH